MILRFFFPHRNIPQGYRAFMQEKILFASFCYEAVAIGLIIYAQDWYLLYAILPVLAVLGFLWYLKSLIPIIGQEVITAASISLLGVVISHVAASIRPELGAMVALTLLLLSMYVSFVPLFLFFTAEILQHRYWTVHLSTEIHSNYAVTLALAIAAFYITTFFIWTGYYRNVEETIRISKELVDAREEVSEAVRSKEHLYGVMVHKLKSPLTSILGYLELLQTRWDTLPDAEKLRYVRKSHENAEFLQRNIESDVDTIRREIYNWPVDIQPINDLCQVLEEPLDALSARYENLNVKVFAQTLKNATVYLDPAAVRLIVHHLVENAVRYGDNSRQIKVFVGEYDDFIEIAVTNWAKESKILRKLKNEIFDAFQTDKGTGLGLYIVRELTKSMGGEVRVEQEEISEGVLTSFIMRFPQVERKGFVKTTNSDH